VAATLARVSSAPAGKRSTAAAPTRAPDDPQLHSGAEKPGDVESRLDLVERLIFLFDERETARAALDWLTSVIPVRRALFLARDEDSNRLVGIAGHGVPPAAVEAFSADVSDPDRELAMALAGREPMWFDARSGASEMGGTPLGRAAFHAIPLGTADGAGLLLLTGFSNGLPEPARWLARFLGVRLRALRSLRLERDNQRLGRDVSRLRTIIDQVTDPILLIDGHGRLLVANKSAEELLVADEEASEGRRRAVALNNMLFSASVFTAAASQSLPRELLLVDPVEGRDLLFEVLASPSEVRKGETGLVAVLRDVTDLRHAAREIEGNYKRLQAAEADARAERDRLELLIDSVAEPVMLTEPSGDRMLMNPPAERLFTVPPGGTDLEAERRVAANDAVFTSALTSFLVDQRARWRTELGLIDPNSGEPLQVEALSGRVFWPSGHEAGVVTILHDLTEAMEKAGLYEQVKRQKEELDEKVLAATAELAEQNELLRRQALELEQASALKSQFLANISHELRTPLNAMLGYTHMLLSGMSGQLVQAQRDKLGRVDSNSRHLLALINDLLDISRIEAGKMPLHLERFNLRELIDEVSSELEPLIDSSGLELRLDVDSELPPAYSDRQKVKQILVNLLSNGLKFTHRGWVLIGALWEEENNRFVVTVSDTGPGIEPELVKRIFEPFGSPSARPVTQPGSSGLGLSICQRLVRFLGGEITLTSNSAGSSFTVMLPQGAP
jgi:PAS domain S-box-containing protein